MIAAESVIRKHVKQSTTKQLSQLFKKSNSASTSLKSKAILVYLKDNVLIFSFLKLIWLLYEATKFCGNISERYK